MAAQNHQIVSMYIKKHNKKRKDIPRAQTMHLASFVPIFITSDGGAQEHMVGLKMDGGGYGGDMEGNGAINA